MNFYIPDTPKPGKEAPSARPPSGLGLASSYRQTSQGTNGNAGTDACMGALPLEITKRTLPTRGNVPPNEHGQVDLSRLSLSPALPCGSSLAVRPASGRHDNRNRTQQGTVNYFSTLTQKFQPSHGTDHQSNVSRCSSGIAGSSLLSRPVLNLGRDDRGNPNGQPGREDGGSNDRHSNSSFDRDFRSTHDASITKLNSLNEKIQSQTQEITELRFALNDADIATAALEAEKRRLKHRNEDLERKVRESQAKSTKLEEDANHLREALQKATNEKTNLLHETSSMSEKSKIDQKRLADAQSALQEAHMKLEVTRSEMQKDMDAAMAQSRVNMETANQTIKSLTLDIQHREEELKFQREANSRLSKQLDEIPDRNFQALGACVKRIFEKLDTSQIELLTNSKTVGEEQVALTRQIMAHLGDVLAASQKHEVALSTFQEKIDLLGTGVSESISTTQAARAETEKNLKEAFDGGLQGVQRNFEMWQTEMLQKLDEKGHDTGMLLDICKKRDRDSKDVSIVLSKQAQVLGDQLQLTRALHSRLQTMEDFSLKDQNTTTLIGLLREEKSALEAKVRDQEAQILKLEASNKQRTDALIEAGDKFAQEVQQLGALYRQRENEYRRVQEQASELAHRETRIYLDESKQETQRELQQERTKRQELERHLRQAKEEVSVLEESYRRCGQSLDALQQELAVTRLRAQGVAEHLEEKVRVLEQERDGDRTVIARLKALLTDKEMDYGNLKNSMKVYDEKVGILMEHLRGWAQDYRHIGAIRSRLEMLGQIDQSCAATARIREAEQIDSVLAHLRQYCARGGRTAAVRDGPVDHADLKESHLPSSETSDGTHEKRIADLSAFLELDTGHKETAQPGEDACDSSDEGTTLQTPVSSVVPFDDSRGTHPPPILHGRRTRKRAMLEQHTGTATAMSGSPQISSPVAQRAQKTSMQKRRYAVLAEAAATESRPKRRQPGTKELHAVRAVRDSASTNAACESQEDAPRTDGNASPSVTIKSENK